MQSCNQAVENILRPLQSEEFSIWFIWREQYASQELTGVPLGFSQVERWNSKCQNSSNKLDSLNQTHRRNIFLNVGKSASLWRWKTLKKNNVNGVELLSKIIFHFRKLLWYFQEFYFFDNLRMHLHRKQQLSTLSMWSMY